MAQIGKTEVISSVLSLNCLLVLFEIESGLMSSFVHSVCLLNTNSLHFNAYCTKRISV